MWSEWRTVTKTATVGLHGNTYEVDAALVGRKVELVFDPFDLTRIEVRWHGRAMGAAVPHRIGRHVHAKARPDDDHPTAGADRDRLPAPGRGRSTPRNWPSGSATPNCPTGTSPASCPCPARPAPARHDSGEVPAVIEKLQSHYGFTRTPFGTALAPQMLHRHGAHAEAVARIGWCVTRTRPRRDHRRGRRRQDRRRPRRPRRPGHQPAHHHLPRQPRRRRPRPLRLHRHRPRRRPPLPQGRADPADHGPARRRGTRTRPHHHRSSSTKRTCWPPTSSKSCGC